MNRMKKILSLLLCVTAVTACFAGLPASAVDTNVTLRVGLTISGESAFADPKLENVSGEAAGYTVGTMDGTTFSGGTALSDTQLTVKLVNDAFQVSNTANGKVLYTSAAGADHLAIRPNSELTWFRGYQWRGDFVYRRSSGGNLTVINYVGLEDYVKGVLPYEIDPEWPEEAQKAQAVCARSFALGTHKHTSDGYDLCNTTNCQVYLGANKATAASDAAVDATKGEYLTYEGEPVIGYFFSSDGGATEDAANVWGGDYPYLKGKIDPYEEYDSSWSVTLTAAEVQKKLISAGYTIGTVANVKVTKRTATDNVNEVTVTDTAGKQVTIEKDEVRTVFGLDSIRYTITPNTSSAAAALPQRASLKISPSTHKVTADGKPVEPQGYNINDNNYYKLRDIAYILNGTDSQFNVAWDGRNNRIELTKGAAYQTVGGEMAASGTTAVESCTPSDSTILLDGKEISLTGYRVNGNNYYKVRDIGEALGFSVGYENETVLIRTTEDAEEQAPVTNAASYTFQGSGWGHSVGMSQWGAYAMAKQGFDYEEILKFYFTGVSVAG
ncbi:hypothetical protein AGATL06_00720 [Agathobaculum sp. TL06]